MWYNPTRKIGEKGAGMLRVGIMGARGWAGEELINILISHPEVNISALTARVEKPVRISEIFPHLEGRLDIECEDMSPSEVAKKCDLVFLALPHTVSMKTAPVLLRAGKRVIDLSGDYRLKDKNLYKKWYGSSHASPQYLNRAVYGLPEIYRDDIRDAEIVANPGCYPVSIILAVLPLVRKGIVESNSIIADSKSGVTGAGREPSPKTHFCEVNENLMPYKVNSHQHMPEINQELSKVSRKRIQITFVPYLLPLDRGILSTVYMTAKGRITEKALLKLYQEFYKGEPFVRIMKPGIFPDLKSVSRTNFCDIGIKLDGNRIIVLSAIDNLLKGASGQAVQNMNIMYGFPETMGLG